MTVFLALMHSRDFGESMCGHVHVSAGLSDATWTDGYILVLYPGSGSKNTYSNIYTTNHEAVAAPFISGHDSFKGT